VFLVAKLVSADVITFLKASLMHPLVPTTPFAKVGPHHSVSACASHATLYFGLSSWWLVYLQSFASLVVVSGGCFAAILLLGWMFGHLVASVSTLNYGACDDPHYGCFAVMVLFQWMSCRRCRPGLRSLAILAAMSVMAPLSADALPR
jgi:H+/Cl- antiporter ClcA